MAPDLRTSNSVLPGLTRRGLTPISGAITIKMNLGGYSTTVFQRKDQKLLRITSY